MRHFDPRPTRFLIGSLALVAATGCGDSTSPAAPEDPGTQLVPIGYLGAGPVWTRDGTEVLYVLRTTVNQKEAALLKAVSISDPAIRQLGEFQRIGELVRSTAGDRLYFGNFVSPPSTAGNYQVIRLHPTLGQQEIVATVDASSDNDAGVAVSGDERFLAVGRHLYDLQTGTRIDLPTGTPIEFSPDGTQLLYYSTTTSTPTSPLTTSPMLISTADGSAQPLHPTNSDANSLDLVHRWRGNAPLLLGTDHNDGFSAVRVFEINGLTGESQDIAQFRGNAFSMAASWSPDGNVLAIWIATGDFFDESARSILYLIRPGNAPAAVGNVAGLPGQPVFSPSGNSIAYFIRYGDLQQGALFLKSGL
jgi:hypothetical protein